MTQHPEIILIFTISISILFSSSVGRYTITTTTPLTDNDVLVSDSGSFAIGFFSPNSKNRYIGLWYNKISDKTKLWVANPANPLVNSTGVLSITSDGTLTITDKDSMEIWSSNMTTKLTNPVAQLLDNGNLVVRELGDNNSNYAWQGFDYPTDTLIADMRFGVEFTTGINRTMTAWSSLIDPTAGIFVSYMETRGVPEMILSDGRKRIWRTGPWDGSHLSGIPYMGTYEGIRFSYVSNKSGVTYSFHLDSFVLSKLVLNSSGHMQRLVWVNDRNSWNAIWTAPTESCDRSGICGNYGLCNMNDNPVCNCLTGFEPKNKMNWNVFRDGTDGCVRKHKLDCASETDGFATVKNVKLPQTENCSIDLGLNLDQCKQSCLSKCSCTAYASASSKDSSGCLIWTGNLFDIRNFANSGEDLYVRLAAIDVPEGEKSRGGEVIAIVASLAAVILLIGSAGCFIWQRKKKRKQFTDAIAFFNEKSYHEQIGEAIDLPMFDFDMIAAATDCFSSVNKLGEGGFGPVYKGKLEDDQEIAVKRLSKTSDQGLEEFKNEVMLIAKLQHRNLVRLLGCCIQGEERMLIYEYMPNNSLNAFLFEKEKKSLLDWKTRYQIIIGIARGLLYLHQDSRFRIIHRDLKAGNILLDEEMKPKISDFGMARIFNGDETDYNTRKVVGTYGYMSPEYAMDGTFSVKSDVYSFGVLVLEIISGKKNKGVYAKPPNINLLAHAWSLWKEGNSIQLVDDSMSNSYVTNEVISCIKIGLLCVQEQPEERPLMSSVVHMFSSDMSSLPQPKQPGFAVKKLFPEVLSSSNNQESWSCDDMSITIVEPR